MYSKQLWGEGQKRLARRRGNNETSARASSEALEMAPRRIFRVQLRVQDNAVDGALTHRTDVLGHAPARQTICTRHVRTAGNASRRLHRPKADRALVDAGRSLARERPGKLSRQDLVRKARRPALKRGRPRVGRRRVGRWQGRRLPARRLLRTSGDERRRRDVLVLGREARAVQ